MDVFIYLVVLPCRAGNKQVQPPATGHRLHAEVLLLQQQAFDSARRLGHLPALTVDGECCPSKVFPSCS